MVNRVLSDMFKNDLLDGVLKLLRKRVMDDNTLMLAIREGYISIYYRGGNILKLSETKKAHTYKTGFDKKYASGSSLSLPGSPGQIASEAEVREWLGSFPKQIASEADLQEWIGSFPVRKQIMDCWFTKHPKMEREFQQLVARENTCSSISNETEYFITDVEMADTKLGARFDMLAFKWTYAERKTDNVRLALIEMKYADDALDGACGITAHLKQFNEFLQKTAACGELRRMAARQINQLNELGLISHSRPDRRSFTVKKEDKFEVVFLFANHNPRSPKLLSELESVEFSSLAAEMGEFCDIRFFIANSSGYAMHEACMAELDDYRRFLRSMR